jgi:acyl-CoA thioesterase-1
MNIRGIKRREIKKILLVLVYGVFNVFLLLSGGCENNDGKPQEANTVENKEMRTIVAVGDSLTAGYGVAEEESYPAILARRLASEGYRYRVINSGVSGETTSGTRARIDWVLSMRPDIVILESGANDGLRGIDPVFVEDNLRQILQILDERGIVVVLAGMKMVWNLGPDYVARFNKIYPKLAKEFNLVFYPFFLEGVAMRADYNQADGVHPNAAGYEIIARQIYPSVLDAIKYLEKKSN